MYLSSKPLQCVQFAGKALFEFVSHLRAKRDTSKADSPFNTNSCSTRCIQLNNGVALLFEWGDSKNVVAYWQMVQFKSFNVFNVSQDICWSSWDKKDKKWSSVLYYALDGSKKMFDLIFSTLDSSQTNTVESPYKDCVIYYLIAWSVI